VVPSPGPLIGQAKPSSIRGRPVQSCGAIGRSKVSARAATFLPSLTPPIQPMSKCATSIAPRPKAWRYQARVPRFSLPQTRVRLRAAAFSRLGAAAGKDR
jgi:hypothetical protein